jgi:iron complex transport system substrate-binding protein
VAAFRLVRPPFLSLAVVALLAACANAPRDGAVTRVDDWGRTVSLQAPARRIVSLSPASTEILFALGLGGRVVGRTRWCDYPRAAREVPDVGEGIGPNVEAVAARRPDLVLLYASGVNRAAAERFAALGIATAALQLDRADDVRRVAILIGGLAGAARAADSLVAAFDSARAATEREAPRLARRPRLYVDVWTDPPMTVGRGSYLSEVIRAAGGANVFGDVRASSATVSLETIARRDPDAILILASDTTRVPDLAARPGWSAVRAVRERRVLVLDGTLYGRPSPRMPVAARDLSGRLARLAVAP